LYNYSQSSFIHYCFKRIKGHIIGVTRALAILLHRKATNLGPHFSVWANAKAVNWEIRTQLIKIRRNFFIYYVQFSILQYL